jgi:hypothetical protein
MTFVVGSFTVDPSGVLSVSITDPFAAPVDIQGCVQLSGTLIVRVDPNLIPRDGGEVRVEALKLNRACASGSFSKIVVEGVGGCLEVTGSRAQQIDSFIVIFFNADFVTQSGCDAITSTGAVLAVAPLLAAIVPLPLARAA